MPELTWPSRNSCDVMPHQRLSVVTPSASVSVIVLTDSASGKPSKTSVEVMLLRGIDLAVHAVPPELGAVVHA